MTAVSDMPNRISNSHVTSPPTDLSLPFDSKEYDECDDENMAEFNQAPPSSSLADNPCDDQGLFLSWGCGEFGQHCHSSREDVACSQGLVHQFSQQMDTKSRVRFAACGSSHTVIVTFSNDIYVWGNGNSGQLGSGDQETRYTPTKIQLYALQPTNPKIRGVACGGRHTFVWLTNGHMFSFGNNFFAQLGYDFRNEKYKENQIKPHLLKTMTYKTVQQVACGEKHTMFLFKGGQVAVVGNGNYGQTGSGSHDEVTVPRVLEDLPKIRMISAGSNHNLAIDDSHQAWMWGYGKACGRKKADVMMPEKVPLPRSNVIVVAGGRLHSMALTANGNIYSWGSGQDGQLGHGERVKFVSTPRKLSDPSLRGRVTYISCGESYSAAVTADGCLYLFGKNSHVIYPGECSTKRVFEPTLVYTGGYSISKVECGSWHAVAVTGKPKWQKHNEDSDDEDDPILDEDLESCVSTTPSECDFSRPREKTMSIGEFYAPTPLPREVRSPSPSTMTPVPNSRSVIKPSNVLYGTPSSLHNKPPVPIIKRPESVLSNRPASAISRHEELAPLKMEWRPVDSTKEAVRDIEIFLPSAKPTPEPEHLEEDDDKKSGKFSLTFFLKESEDGQIRSLLPTGTDEMSLPGNRKATGTVSMVDQPVNGSIKSHETSLLNKPGHHQRKFSASSAGAESYSSVPPGRFVKEKKIELRAANTFIIDKTWDMYNTHLKGPGSTTSSASSKSPPARHRQIQPMPHNSPPPKRNSNAPAIALQRSRTLLMQGSVAPASTGLQGRAPRISSPSKGEAARHKPQPGPSSVQDQSGKANVENIQRCLKNPTTVSFTPPKNKEATRLGPHRQISIPGRTQQRSHTQLGLDIGGPQWTPSFSSATSWKHDRDKGKLTRNPLGKANANYGAINDSRDAYNKYRKVGHNIPTAKNKVNGFDQKSVLDQIKSNAEMKSLSVVGTTGSVLSDDGT